MTLTSDSTTKVAQPHLVPLHGRRQLIVDGQPFLVLGAELHNSTGSHAAAINRGFDRAVSMNANTVLVSASWELVEPTEGRFDFDLVHEAITAARARDLRLILLWFGSWKNAVSSYVPEWVKRDLQRFPRSESRERILEHVSPFGPEIAAAEGRAFAELTRYLAARDGQQQTVIMVQVDNEVGLLGDSRDRSGAAERAWASPAPPAAEDALQQTLEPAGSAAQSAGSWADRYGDDPRAEEAFMAVAFASHLQRVAQAGLAEYVLPLFTNAWLDSDINVPGSDVAGGTQPGSYPSGGPIPRVAPIWRAMAPALDILAPDIYFGDFDAICAAFAQASDQALLIPEMRRDATGAGQIFVALGSHGALGVSPFGIDSGPADQIDDIADAFGLIQAVTREFSASRLEDMRGFHITAGGSSQRFELRGRSFEVSATRSWGGLGVAEQAYGLVLAIGDDEFVAIGRGFAITPAAVNGRGLGIASITELLRGGGELTEGRRLNGDETHGGANWIHTARGHAPTTDFPIPAVGESSGVSRCRLYEY